MHFYEKTKDWLAEKKMIPVLTLRQGKVNKPQFKIIPLMSKRA